MPSKAGPALKYFLGALGVMQYIESQMHKSRQRKQNKEIPEEEGTRGRPGEEQEDTSEHAIPQPSSDRPGVRKGENDEIRENIIYTAVNEKKKKVCMVNL